MTCYVSPTPKRVRNQLILYVTWYKVGCLNLLTLIPVHTQLQICF